MEVSLLHFSDTPASESYFFKTVFFICQIFLAVETVFQSSGNVFLTSSLFWLVGTDFLPSGNSILLFRAFLKFLQFEDSNFFKGNLIHVRGN